MRRLWLIALFSLGAGCAHSRAADLALEFRPLAAGWGRGGELVFRAELGPQMQGTPPDVVVRRAPRPSLSGTLWLEFRDSGVVAYRLTIRDAPYERFTRAVLVQRAASARRDRLVLFDGAALSGWYIQVRGEGGLVRGDGQLLTELQRSPEIFEVRVEGSTAGGVPLVLAGSLR